MSTIAEDFETLQSRLQSKYADKTEVERLDAFARAVQRVSDTIFGQGQAHHVLGVQTNSINESGTYGCEVISNLRCWGDVAYALGQMSERVEQINPHAQVNEAAPDEVTDDLLDLLPGERVYAPHEVPQAVQSAASAVAAMFGIPEDHIVVVGPDSASNGS